MAPNVPIRRWKGPIVSPHSNIYEDTRVRELIFQLVKALGPSLNGETRVKKANEP